MCHCYIMNVYVTNLLTCSYRFTLEFIMDCNFDQGACEWVQDKADDIDWSVAYHDDGNRIINIFLSSHLRSI